MCIRDRPPGFPQKQSGSYRRYPGAAIHSKACSFGCRETVPHWPYAVSYTHLLAGMILKRLRFPNRDLDRVCSLIRYHVETLPLPEKRLKKLLGEFGGDWVFELFSLMRANLAGQDPNRLEEHLTALRDLSLIHIYLASPIIKRRIPWLTGFAVSFWINFISSFKTSMGISFSIFKEE